MHDEIYALDTLRFKGWQVFKASKMRDCGTDIRKEIQLFTNGQRDPCSDELAHCHIFGPPIAAKRIASADLAASKVDLGSGWPSASIPALPEMV